MRITKDLVVKVGRENLRGSRLALLFRRRVGMIPLRT